MFRKQDDLDKLSLVELERLVKIRQREARKERFLRLSAKGASNNTALLSEDELRLPATGLAKPTASNAGRLPTAQIQRLSGKKGDNIENSAASSSSKKWRDGLLLVMEIGALVGLVAVLALSYLNLTKLNEEVAEARGINQSKPLVLAEDTAPVAVANANITTDLGFDRLPGGHSSPTAAGGAVPDIPPHLQDWVQPGPVIPIPDQTAAVATRIVIPKINVDAPIVQGVTWEDLKKGVGHLPGSAQPGERGNLYLAAHNDIFGEIFRYLNELEPGDEYHIYAGQTKFTYIVREKRIIDPTEVDVMLPTTEPVATLQTCYPYLIDSHRLVVISDLVE